MEPNLPMTATFTHYSYMSCPHGCKREPTGIFNLGEDCVGTRRTLIHNLIRNGELLATLPFPEIKNMRQLRGALNWLHENGPDIERR